MMTSYETDSPNAIARLLALAVTVDGVPAEAELEMLDKRGVLRHLGLDQAGFNVVIDALCADLRSGDKVGDAADFTILRPAQLEAMLNEVQSPALQRDLIALFIEIFSADHRYQHAESVFLRGVLRYWGADEQTAPVDSPAIA
jgi:uncharacterized tellurite resistance protein B-like protein